MDQASHERTPKKILLLGNNKKTPISTPKNFSKRFLLLSSNNAANITPRRDSKSRIVKNPFEAQLHEMHEKLRLPFISSPSLFQAPKTPKQEDHKLEMFEWTIEELSNLNPVNVVPHETQFSSEIDPQLEEKAQAAISSFFQEQQIVPSPHVCNLRGQKITTSNIYNSTALTDKSNPGAMISTSIIDCQVKISKKRDIMTQTAISFPPNLPKEIEDLLQKYQINGDEQCSSSEEVDLDRGNNSNSLMMDISTLRRKLFIQRPETPDNDYSDDDAFGVGMNLNLSPAPKTPELSRRSFNMSSQHIDNNIGEAFGVINSDMFGELSPIIKNDSANNSSTMSSNDISMTSDCTPARRRCNTSKLKKKRLSESFSLLQNDFVNEEFDNNDENKENRNKVSDARHFRRFDSGFENGDSNHTMNCSFSAELMQI